MKELSKFQMAAVKRTAQNVKSLLRRKERLEAKQEELTKQINEIQDMVDMWEQPVIKMTGGFTSSQVLNGEMETDVFNEETPTPNGDELNDEPLDEIPVNEGTTEVEPEEVEEELPSW